MSDKATVLDDPDRIAAVLELGLLEQPFNERFDRVTRTAQRVLGAPLAFLNLVTADSLWVTSCVGFNERTVDRDVAFCSYVVESRETVLVDDMTVDPRFMRNPLVLEPPHLRAYAGHPLRGASGHIVGTLCVMDVRPRTWSVTDREALVDLAVWAEDELTEGDVNRKLLNDARVQRQSEQVLLNAGPGIVGIDASGVVTVANPAVATLTGWSTESLLGRPLHDTLHPRDDRGMPCQEAISAENAVSRQGSRRWRGMVTREDASELFVRLSGTAILEGDIVTGAVFVFDRVEDN